MTLQVRGCGSGDDQIAGQKVKNDQCEQWFFPFVCFCCETDEGARNQEANRSKWGNSWAASVVISLKFEDGRYAVHNIPIVRRYAERFPIEK